mgnify:FL=1
MKKALSLILLFAICLGLTGCGNNKVELTLENVKEYLNITASVTDSDVEKTSKSVAGIYTKAYKGTSKVELRVTNQSGMKFQNVEIKCKLSVFNRTAGGIYGWEFNTQNVHEGETLSDDNYKYVTIVLPYDGNWSGTEKLTLKPYSDGYKFTFDVKELDSCQLEIISVSGTAIKE